MRNTGKKMAYLLAVYLVTGCYSAQSVQEKTDTEMVDVAIEDSGMDTIDNNIIVPDSDTIDTAPTDSDIVITDTDTVIPDTVDTSVDTDFPDTDTVNNDTGSEQTSPTRADVVQAMETIIVLANENCGHLGTGRVSVRIIVAANGTVLDATPTSDYSDTALGLCVADVVRTNLVFPPFTKETFIYTYLIKID